MLTSVVETDSTYFTTPKNGWWRISGSSAWECHRISFCDWDVSIIIWIAFYTRWNCKGKKDEKKFKWKFRLRLSFRPPVQPFAMRREHPSRRPPEVGLLRVERQRREHPSRRPPEVGLLRVERQSKPISLYKNIWLLNKLRDLCGADNVSISYR